MDAEPSDPTAPQGQRVEVDVIEWVKNRINAGPADGDDVYRFAFRELAQNADDAKASIMVIKMTDSSLLVANDGRSFRIGEDDGDDFERIRRIMGGHDKENPEAIGAFGSGFYSVFVLTNRPHVISNGRWEQIDIVKQEPIIRDADNAEIRNPYRADARGVIFELPWRTHETAQEEIGGERPFMSEADWRRWPAAERSLLFEKLKEYLRHLIIATRNLKTIRLLWEGGDETIGFQVTRDFTCEPDPQLGGALRTAIVTITEEEGWGGWTADSWDKSGPARSFRYLRGQRLARNSEGELVWFTKDGVTVASEAPPGSKIAQPDVWVFLPLFPTPGTDLDSRGSFVNSGIPVPIHTDNHFVISAHLFTTEDRKKLRTNAESYVPWAAIVLRTAADMYLDLWETYVEKVKGMSQDDQWKQRTLLDNLPSLKITAWLGEETSRDIAGHWRAGTQDLMREMMRTLVVGSPILRTTGAWRCFEDAIWADEEEFADVLSTVLEGVGIANIRSEVIRHPKFQKDVAPNVQNRLITPSKFSELWAGKGGVLARYGDQDDALHYGQELEPGVRFDERYTNALLAFTLTREGAPNEYRKLPLVPTESGDILPIDSLRTAPGNHESLAALLPPQRVPRQVLGDTIKLLINDEAGPKELLEGATQREIEPARRMAIFRDLFAYLSEVDSSAHQILPNRSHIQAQGYQFVPDSAGIIRPPGDVCYAPPDWSEATRRLFEAHGIEVNWVHPEIEEVFAGPLHKLGIDRPPYEVLAKAIVDQRTKLTMDVKKLVLEGMHARFKEEGSRSPQDASQVPCLGSGTRLVAPSDALYETTGDPKLDAWIGVLDEDLKDFAWEQGARAFVVNAGALQTKPSNVLRKIDSMVRSHPDRFSNLDETDFEGASRAMVYVHNDGNVPAQSYQYAFLPVQHRGSITLSQPPPFELKAGGHQGENYSRKFPFIGATREAETLHEAILGALKIVTLHPSVEIDPSDLSDTLPLVPLTAVNIVRHLIADYPKRRERSLFREDSLKEFLGDAPATLMGEVKISLLTIVPTYFDSAKTENGLRPEDMAVVPLLMDDEGRWGAPTEFTSGMDLKMDIFEKRVPGEIHGDWGQATFKALGVTPAPAASIVQERIERFADSHDVDRLGEAFRILASMEDVRTREAIDAIQEVPWILTHGGELRRPSDTIIPTKHNAKILGENHPRFVAPAFIQHLDTEDDRTRLAIKDLGVQQKPPAGWMLDVIQDCMQAGSAPPPNLQSALAELKNLAEEVDPTVDYKYYHGGRWFDSEAVFLDGLDFLPPQLRDRYVTHPPEGHRAFLQAIGAREHPSPEDLVRWLAATDVRSSRDLWRKFVEVAGNMPPGTMDGKADGPIPVHPLDSEIDPKRTFLADLEERIQSGPVIVIPTTSLDDEERHALLVIGVRPISELGPGDLLRLQEESTRHDDPTDLHLLILRCLMKFDALPTSPLVPLDRDGNETTFVKLPKSLYPDDPVSRFRWTRAPMIDIDKVPTTERFIRWALSHGMQLLSEVVEVEPEGWGWGDGERDEQLEQRFVCVSRALKEMFRSRKVEWRPEMTSWLDDLEVFARAHVQVKITVGDESTRHHVGCIHETRTDGSIRLYLPAIGPETHYRDIAETVFSLTLARDEHESLRIGIKRDLINEIIILLRTRPDRWPEQLEDVSYRGPPLPALFDEIEDYSEDNFWKVRGALAHKYKGCQICTRATPANRDGTETREKLKSIVAQRAGIIRGEETPTNLGNSLWLCPLHHHLAKVGLVDFVPLSGGTNEALKTLQDLQEHLEAGEIPGGRLKNLQGLFLARSNSVNPETGQIEEELEDSIYFEEDHLRQVLAFLEETMMQEGG